MRWLSFVRDGRATYGVARTDGIVDVGARHRDLATLKDVLAAGRLGALGSESAGLPVDCRLDAVRYLPVITQPDKILCVGLNYRAHLEETGREASDKPTIFVRFAAAQVAHGEAMWRPRESDRLDYEGEIALVIGRGGRRIARDAALSHVAGYAPYNDGSVRDWQRHTTQFTPGKNFTRTGGFGPWMMTPDEVGDPDALEITTRLNGNVMQNSKASLLIFGFAELIEYCSTFIELVPGDVIVTGTPGGVGAARNPPVFMRDGDRIEIEVKPIGTLVNMIEPG